MANELIKKYAKEKNVKLWEIAQKLGCYDSTLSKWLCVEFSEDRRNQIIAIIDEISTSRKE